MDFWKRKKTLLKRGEIGIASLQDRKDLINKKYNYLFDNLQLSE